MRSPIVAVLAVIALGGCVAVPASYHPADAYYYYPGPAVGVGIYSAPAYYHGRHRHHPRHQRQRHWR